MGKIRLLSPQEIRDLSSNLYENLGTVIEHCSANDLKIRLAALEKLADDFPPSTFISKYYPRNEVFELFRNAIKSDVNEEVCEALSAVTEIDNAFARDLCIQNIYHHDLDIREEAVCCLGYVATENDSKTLSSFMENESCDLIKVAAFNSLLRLGHDELLLLDRIDPSQLSIEACVSVLENLCTLTDRYDLSKAFQSISSRIANLGCKEINDELYDLKYRIDKEVVLNEIETIFSSDKVDWKRVIELMKNSDCDIRFRALSGIGSGSKPFKKTMPQKPPQQVFDKVVALAGDEDEEVRAEAISVLGDWEYIKSIDLISKHLHDDSELVRLDAIYALGEIQGHDALEKLEQLSMEQCSEVEKVRLYQSLIRCGRRELLEKWLYFLKSNDALVRANVAGGTWSVCNSDSNAVINSALEVARNKETHIFVLNEIDDALDWLRSKETL
ncbi:HEAT repeat domain-containing protein [Pseudoalteromonas sp. S554]|jgi:HEAT repeat protein|uniref:HEAT repeat domain-containing protein n=1 Tax=Pseudoalteromonas sp. S554 TaxID=2066516 RepID=UPI00110CCE3F|nr:HEAT repeat domain-containing protein [Pseudoalteromonas sp. S554]TMS83083.1 hypothetical protein CWB65_02290 [Pseudoalteromonas sp. S554]